MAISITLTASCAAGGETKELSSTATLDAAAVTSGTQTVGNTYEDVGLLSKGFTAVIIKNLGTVDISIRLTASRYTTSQYVAYTVPPSGVFVVPPMIDTDNGPGNVAAVGARTFSGTANLDYCIIR